MSTYQPDITNSTVTNISNVPNVTTNINSIDYSNNLLTDGPINIRPQPNNFTNWKFSNVYPYKGNVYAFYAQGGYTIDQCFNTIKLIPESKIYTYDVTNAVQVRFDVRTFNEKIGLFKDALNQYVLLSSFDPVRDAFTTWTVNQAPGWPSNPTQNVANFPILDSITITADEFVRGLDTNSVISVGTYATLYSDFNNYVNTYFGYSGGFSSLFSGASEFNINNGVFDASAFINIINPYYTASGENVKPLTGSITIPNINSLLKYAINTNVFNNRSPIRDLSSSDPGINTGPLPPGLNSGELNLPRDPSLNNNPNIQTSSNTVMDASFSPTAIVPPVNYQVTQASSWRADWGMADGFLAGDLIFIPAGTTVSLHLVIDSDIFSPENNIGPQNVGYVNRGAASNQSTTTTTNNGVTTTTFNSTANGGASSSTLTPGAASITSISNTITPLSTSDPYYNSTANVANAQIQNVNGVPTNTATGQVLPITTSTTAYPNRNYSAFYSNYTTATELNIDRTLTAPLLLKLDNLSSDFFNNATNRIGIYKGGYNNNFSEGSIAPIDNVTITTRTVSLPGVDGGPSQLIGWQGEFRNANYYDANNVGRALTYDISYNTQTIFAMNSTRNNITQNNGIVQNNTTIGFRTNQPVLDPCYNTVEIMS